MIPIIRRFEPAVDESDCARVDALAAKLLQEQPDLRLNAALRRFTVHVLDDAPSLHLDDLTSIALLDRFHDVSFAEDRARLRAANGDLVASCAAPTPSLEPYCARDLGLGAVHWLHPRHRGDPKGVASACWADAGVRKELVTGLRDGRFRYLHPHMGNHAVWSLAVLLSKASGRRLRVIAPHPGLTRAVNDKNWFVETASRLFGAGAIPRTMRACSLAGLAHVLRRLAAEAPKLVVKVPDSAGGAGTLLIEARELRALSNGELKNQLRERLRPLRWQAGDPLLVASWETGDVEPISSQLWIPPELGGAPVVEGVFQQFMEEALYFAGAYPAELPTGLTQTFADRSWLLARLFQRLGYVGRCSFDAIVVGTDAGRKLELIECNGRWGGTSAPMTLMNRLFGREAPPYASRRCHVSASSELSFGSLLQRFSADVYSARTGRGRLIFYDPAGLQSAASIDVIGIGDSRTAAAGAVAACCGELQRLAADPAVAFTTARS